MEYKSIIFTKKEEGFGILTLNRPDVLNAFDRHSFQEIGRLLDEIKTGHSIRGLIITGSGRAFASGADLSEIRDDGIEENREYSGLAQSVFCKVEELDIPVIAAINGYALGGGCELALACDIRIAGENAKFGMPEVALGVIPCFGGTQRLPRLIGAARAKELVFTGKKISGIEAQALGLVNKVVPQEKLMEEAQKLMKQILQNSSIALKYAKLSIRIGQEMAMADALEFEKDMSAICYGLPDKKEGMTAFFEKRIPNYQKA